MNKGKIVENLVFVELKRRNKEIYYFLGENECDFLIKEGTNIKDAIQVCYSLDENNREREVEGLLEAMNKLKLKEGLILTREQEDEIRNKDKKIKIMPVWRWMIEK